MRKYLNYIVIILLLAGLTVFLILRQKKSTLNKALSDFSVKDTAAVDKIFLADMQGVQVSLTKNGKKWLIDGKQDARMDAVQMILSTLHDLKVKYPVAKAAFNNIIKDMATSSVKVEIYAAGIKTKTIYVGSPTKDHDGTYMMLEGSSTPFVVEIPGFQGYLSTRFFTSPEQWRASELLSYNIAQIRDLEVSLHTNPASSFSIHIEKDPTQSRFRFTLFDVKKQSVPNFDTSLVMQYLSAYKKVNYEFIAKQTSKTKLDSALSKPYLSLLITEHSSKKKKIDVLAIPLPPGSTNRGGENISFDDERAYVLVDNNRQEIFIGQYFVFDRLAVPLSSLLKK
ncbi:MAG: DUF4340 domain-containing protein [Bacteroidota bacterium]|jgi:hypothetical protein